MLAMCCPCGNEDVYLQTAMKPVNIVKTLPADCSPYGEMTLTMLLAEYCPQKE